MTIGWTVTTSSDSTVTLTLANATLDGDDEEPPTLGGREPRRPLLPTLDGAVALEEPAE